MDQETRVRIAHNESIFREVNERIQGRNATRIERDEPISFVCECGNRDCHAMVEMMGEDYESIRADATHFLVIPGHEIEAAERVVEEGDTYYIVEKMFGDARAEAERTDPRS